MHNVRVEVRHVDGYVAQVQQTHNEVTESGWEMLAALLGSNEAYTYAINKMKAGSSAQAVSVSDRALVAPWTMSYITSTKATAGRGTLKQEYGIAPNVYTGNVVRELGFYFDVVTGASPITAPGLYARCVLPAPITMVADYGVYVSHDMGWNG